MGAIDEQNGCCTKTLLIGGLADGPQGGISPGCGCADENVSVIFEDLKKRVRNRGDAAQLRFAEATYESVSELQRKVATLEAKLDKIMLKLDVA